MQRVKPFYTIYELCHFILKIILSENVALILLQNNIYYYYY